jgi:hypothetical protein
MAVKSMSRLLRSIAFRVQSALSHQSGTFGKSAIRPEHFLHTLLRSDEVAFTINIDVDGLHPAQRIATSVRHGWFLQSLSIALSACEQPIASASERLSGRSCALFFAKS